MFHIFIVPLINLSHLHGSPHIIPLTMDGIWRVWIRKNFLSISDFFYHVGCLIWAPSQLWWIDLIIGILNPQLPPLHSHPPPPPPPPWCLHMSALQSKTCPRRDTQHWDPFPTLSTVLFPASFWKCTTISLQVKS